MSCVWIDQSQSTAPDFYTIFLKAKAYDDLSKKESHKIHLCHIIVLNNR